MDVSTTLPPTLEVDWLGQPATFRLRFEIPKVWTQEESRRFGLYWSEDLGHGILSPSPTDEELDRFYDTEAYRAYLGTEQADRTHRTSLLERVVTKIAYTFDKSPALSETYLAERLPSGAEVCDVGCGAGDFLAGIAKLGLQPTGVDPSEVAVAAVQGLGIPCFRGSAEELPEDLRSRRFDAVTMHHALEHCRDPLAALANLRGITRPGGYGLFEVPNHENAGFNLYGPAWYHTDAGRHLHFFTARSLTAMAEKAGWRVESVGYLFFTRQFQGYWLDGCRNVFDRLYADGTAPVQRPNRVNNLTHLARALAMPDARKYDVLRVVLRND